MSGNHSTTQHTVFLKTYKYVGCTGDGFTFGILKPSNALCVLYILDVLVYKYSLGCIFGTH